MPTRLICCILLFLLSSSFRSSATHIVGGEVGYVFLDSVAGGNRYRISLSIYEDCQNGTPWAIASDAQAFYAIYNGANQLILFDSVWYDSSMRVPPNYDSSCLHNPPKICLLRRTFHITVVLPPDSTGYIFEYQRCCRNAATVNLIDPANFGGIYYCNIPPSVAAAHNNSAVFKNYPPQIICANTPLQYDNSATDADGDSLTYELCTSYSIPNAMDIAAAPDPPPFTMAQYAPTFSYSNPMNANPPISVDVHTGMLSGRPDVVGRFLVTVCCNEWRHGIKINTIKREFQFVVTDCTKMVMADIPLLSDLPNTYVLDCKDYTVAFENASSGASSWLWSFGVPGAGSSGFQPTYTYPDTGIYTVKLVANPGAACTDSIERLVRVFPLFEGDFSWVGNQCLGLPIAFTNKSIDSSGTTIFTQWYFGDGNTSSELNPVHIFPYGGTFNVILVNASDKGCKDTVVRPVIIQNFRALAGNDTVIVKGEAIKLNAQGGIKYSWFPPDNLSSTSINDPTGYFLDTGHYSYGVHVTSAYGCSGDANVRIRVVDHAFFVMPTAFSPNGDGLNDLFRPISVGASDLKYFRVFNRFGETVYYSTSLDGDGWDGRYKGALAEMGTYFWELEYTDLAGKQVRMKGDVTLLR